MLKLRKQHQPNQEAVALAIGGLEDLLASRRIDAALAVEELGQVEGMLAWDQYARIVRKVTTTPAPRRRSRRTTTRRGAGGRIPGVVFAETGLTKTTLVLV